MRPFIIIAALLACICSVSSTTDNLTDLVTWDKYSLSVNGKRVYINSAEFHYQRLPVPELWLDVFQKFKANGFNTLSIYSFWSYHSASKGVYDFESPGKNIQQLFDYAKEAGLWVIMRAGPYCNAETNGGGLALWGSDGSMGSLRTGDETYHEAWLPWVQEIGAIIAANQITNGGPVILNQIENELQETSHLEGNTLVTYMEQVESAFRDAGVTVPFTSNEKGMRSESWSTDYQDVGGAVNVYGLDSYPGGTSCTDPDSGFKVVRTYYQWFQNYSSTQPEYLPEFEAGYFTPWGGEAFYDDCTSDHSPEFPDVYYKNNIGQKVTMQSLYMAYGGTNWGHSAAPVVYTSYDYSAPLRETRQQWDKLFQTKLVNLFTKSTPDLLKTEMIGNGTGYQVSSNSVFTWVLQNPDTSATFTVTQQDSTKSTGNITFSATLDTSAGSVNVSNISLLGRQSRILVTDYAFGKHTLLYSSADIATYGNLDGADAIVLYLKEGQTGEFAFKNETGLTYSTYGSTLFGSSNSSTIGQAFTYTQGAGASFVKFSNGVLVYLLDQPTAWKFWAPSTSAEVYGSPDETIFVLGPYLVRNASVSNGVLEITGDNDNTTTLEAFVGSTPVNTLIWNGQHLNATKTPYGTYTATIPGTESRTISLPSLDTWTSADSLPETHPDFDDSAWVVCNKTETSSPVAPLTLPVLFSSDYGYYAGAKLYRGYFPAGPAFTAVNITASGGLAFGWNVWLNGVPIGGDPGNASLTTTTRVLDLPASALARGRNSSSSRSGTNGGTADHDNVLTVLVDYHGHDETSTSHGLENPRGILGAQLLGPASSSTTTNANISDTGFSLWKVQGNAGGPANIDPVRGPMNEGGLYAERLGWHLPGFSPSGSGSGNGNGSAAWDSSTPQDGLSAPGVRLYLTHFTLDVDADLDAPLGIILSAPAGTVARVMVWVNGYQYGKYVPHVGPQSVFPVPPGVLDPRGANTLAVSVWAQESGGARLEGVGLVCYGVYQSGFGGFGGGDGGRLRPGWVDRSGYV